MASDTLHIQDTYIMDKYEHRLVDLDIGGWL
jgi:hypothetical protein